MWLVSLAWMPPPGPTDFETRLMLVLVLLFAVVPWFFRKALVFLACGMAIAAVTLFDLFQHWRFYRWMLTLPDCGPLNLPVTPGIFLAGVIIGRGCYLGWKAGWGCA